jgi:hypothetical protein
MPTASTGLEVLSAMITPAILMLACGTLISSTATRLARIVDRVRALSALLEQLWSDPSAPLADERRAHAEEQLALHAQRSRLIQGSLTSLYISLGIFVGTSVAIGVVTFVPRLSWLPPLLGLTGALLLLTGCVFLIRETRLALGSVKAEMDFVLGLRRGYQVRRPLAR